MTAAALDPEVRAFIDAGRALVGKARWRHRGRKPWAVDCIGLLVLSARAAGVGERWRVGEADDIPYGREPWDDGLRQALQGRFGAPLLPAEAKPGDIALIRWRAGEPSHVAIVADHPDGGLSMIHAHSLSGVCEHRIAGPFAEYIVEVYRPWPDTPSQ